MIIGYGKIKEEYRKVFLTAPYFEKKPIYPQEREAFTNFFKINEPSNLFEETIDRFVKEEIEQNIWEGKWIEYWFQHQTEGTGLDPHCDFNHKIRESKTGEWMHEMPFEDFLSPLSYVLYLNCTMDGGDLCISELTWLDEEDPLAHSTLKTKKIFKTPFRRHSPKAGEYVFFEGSKHYHWIDMVKSGERKSMILNFWNENIKGK